MAEDKRCETCRHWHLAPPYKSVPAGNECRKYAPIMVQLPPQNPRGGWLEVEAYPRTTAQTRCRYRQKRI